MEYFILQPRGFYILRVTDLDKSGDPQLLFTSVYSCYESAQGFVRIGLLMDRIKKKPEHKGEGI